MISKLKVFSKWSLPLTDLRIIVHGKGHLFGYIMTFNSDHHSGQSDHILVKSARQIKWFLSNAV